MSVDVKQLTANLVLLLNSEDLQDYNIDCVSDCIEALEQLQKENKELREVIKNLDSELKYNLEWICVKDKLPEEGQKVLSCYLGVYQADIVVFWKDTVNHHFGHQPATHWKPLPKPPEAKQ